MALTKYKLGRLIELCDERNANGQYALDDVKGISIQKCFIETKANMEGVSLTPYILVKPDYFVYVTVTSRNGEKITLAHNTTEDTYIVSSSYVVFKVIDSDVLLSDYLFMFFNRPEFDRYARFNSWGSARETFDWDTMCDIDIELPDIPTQQKYVDIYNAMLANQQSYERGLEDLKLSIDAIIEKYKHSVERSSLGEISVESDVRNQKRACGMVKGVNKDRKFMPAVASGEDLSKYKVVQKNQFACNLMHVGRDVAVPIALHSEDEPIIVSPAYVVFEITNEKVLPQYVLMWLSRTESDRHAWFMCDNNIRGGMEKKRFFEMDIPAPSIEEQRILVELFEAMSLRQAINEKLKSQIKDICPILIKGSLEEEKTQ